MSLILYVNYSVNTRHVKLVICFMRVGRLLIPPNNASKQISLAFHFLGGFNSPPIPQPWVTYFTIVSVSVHTIPWRQRVKEREGEWVTLRWDGSVTDLTNILLLHLPPPAIRHCATHHVPTTPNAYTRRLTRAYWCCCCCCWRWRQ